MHTVKIGKRSFPLAFTLNSLIEMQESFKDFNIGDLKQLISTPRTMVDVLYILAKDGAELSGTPLPLDVNREWMAVHISPAVRKVLDIRIAIFETVVEGMTMESEEDEERSREIDVVLQESQKKRTDSDGGKSQPGD